MAIVDTLRKELEKYEKQLDKEAEFKSNRSSVALDELAGLNDGLDNSMLKTDINILRRLLSVAVLTNLSVFKKEVDGNG